MSLRDFNAPFPDHPRALHNAPLGNGTGLDNFHTRQPEDIEPNNTPKIIGAVAVALMIGTAGIAFYASSGSHPAQPKPVVASNLPAPPATQPSPAPVAQEPAAMTPDANTPATPPAAADNQPASPVKEASAPVPKKHKAASSVSKSASASETADSGVSARMAADSTQSTVQPAQQQAITAPTPSPSDVATNNTQSGVAVSPNATTASDMPAASAQTDTAQNNTVAPQEASTPQANTSVPAQGQQSGATPAPAQSAGQVNP